MRHRRRGGRRRIRPCSDARFRSPSTPPPRSAPGSASGTFRLECSSRSRGRVARSRGSRGDWIRRCRRRSRSVPARIPLCASPPGSPNPKFRGTTRAPRRPSSELPHARQSTGQSSAGSRHGARSRPSWLPSLLVAIFRLAKASADQLLRVLRRGVQLLRHFRYAVALQISQTQRDLAFGGDARECLARRQLIG